jgi:hypothetical protein
MKIQCQIEPSDYVQAQYLHFRLRPLTKLLLVVLSVLLVVVSLHQIIILQDIKITGFSIILLAVGVYYAIVFGAWLPYRTKKIYWQQKALQEPFVAEISSDEFVSTNSIGTARLRWKDFHKYKVGKNLILVYQSDAIFHMFPRRWFGEGEYETLLEILKSSLGPPKQ